MAVVSDPTDPTTTGDPTTTDPTTKSPTPPGTPGTPVPPAMAAYTPNAGLAKPATAARNWDVALNANADLLDAVAAIGQLAVTPTEAPSASLSVAVSGGSYGKADGTVGSFPGVAPYALAASSVTALWLTDSGVLSGSTGFPQTAHVRLASVTTGPSNVTNVTDARFGPRTGGTGLGFVLKTGDTVSGGFSVASAGSGSVAFSVVPDQASVGFFGVTPQTQGSSIAPIVDNSTGTPAAAVIDVGSNFNQALIDNNFATLAAAVNALIAAVKRHGLMAS